MIQPQPSQTLVKLPFQIDARKTLWTQFSGSKNRIATRRWNLGGQKIDEKFVTYRIGNRPKPKPTKQSGNTNFVKNTRTIETDTFMLSLSISSVEVRCSETTESGPMFHRWFYPSLSSPSHFSPPRIPPPPRTRRFLVDEKIKVRFRQPCVRWRQSFAGAWGLRGQSNNLGPRLGFYGLITLASLH